MIVRPISRYALKKERRALREAICMRHKVSSQELDRLYQGWLRHQRATAGRATPASRTEEIGAEVIWLRERLRRLEVQAK